MAIKKDTLDQLLVGRDPKEVFSKVGLFSSAIEFWPRSAGYFWPTTCHSSYGSSDWIGGPFVDWKAKVDLFEQLRREHEFGIGTIAGVATKFGVHRRVVRRAIASALPPPHHYPGRSKPKLGAFEAFIDKVLDEDRRAPRKQRHTARRIYRRILTEFPDAVVA